MGTVLATTLGVAFASMPLEPVREAGLDPVEFVSTGGAELPGIVRDIFDERATSAPTVMAAESIRREGDQLAEEIGADIRVAFTRATGRIYWLTAIIALLAAVLVLRIPELPLRTTHDRAVTPEGSTEP